MSTIFGKIIRREIPADFVYEDDLCVAFRDINPLARVHVLVVPKKPVVNIADAEQGDAALLGHLLWVCGEVARQEGIGDAFRVMSNSGAGAGQTVFHLHLHVLGGGPLPWPA